MLVWEAIVIAESWTAPTSKPVATTGQCAAGLQCPLAQQLFAPEPPETVSHYISDLKSLTKDSQEPNSGVKSATERFIWEFLAQATAKTAQQAAGTPAQRTTPQSFA